MNELMVYIRDVIDLFRIYVSDIYSLLINDNSFIFILGIVVFSVLIALIFRLILSVKYIK